MSLPETSIEIPGINTHTGIALYGGETDNFIFALQSFLKHMPVSIEKLRNVTAENLSNYSTSVHGFKSVCAAIGAEELREKAFRLELASKAGDLKTVLAENDILVKDTEKLVADVKAWLEKK